MYALSLISFPLIGTTTELQTDPDIECSGGRRADVLDLVPTSRGGEIRKVVAAGNRSTEKNSV
jgi:hypothetical protein